MPKPKSGSLTVALSQNTDNSNSTRSPGPSSNLGKSAQSATYNNTISEEPVELTPVSVPQSPASPKGQSKSFFSGYRSSRLGKSRGQEYAAGRLPSAGSTKSLEVPASYVPTRPISPSSSTASASHGNLLDTLSLSDRSGVNGSAVSELEQHETEWAYDSLQRVDSDSLSQRRPSRHVFQQFINRSRSTRSPDMRVPSRPNTGRRPLDPALPEEYPEEVPHTAPLDVERSYRDAMNSSNNRNKSADRVTTSSKDGSEGQFKPSSSYESAGLLSNIKSTSTRAADGIGRAGKGFFGRLTRAGSGNDRETENENYVFRVINLPLIEQTRRTRIRRRIEDAKDKTEYWMPALPYRCIDYLNLKGVEEEGLYRIPGSGREIRHWQTRFDSQLDVNLLEEPELYDINIIGSMLKAWLRELPDELFPKAIQSRIAMECAGAKETPQLMKDELSKLPPFNYYLLFAITCHIAILHSHSEKNKMNYQNLCICFQPCMGIDGFCFQFLVCDWRNCWQGCWTEKDFYLLEEESRGMELPTSSAGYSVGASSSHISDERAFSATSGSRPATGGPGSSESSEKRRPSPISAHEDTPEWEESRPTTLAPPAQTSSRTRNATGHSTPPTLSPLATVSPMRL